MGGRPPLLGDNVRAKKHSIVRVGGDRLVSTLLVLEDDTFGALWVAVDVGLPSGLDASAPKWNPKRK